MTEAELVFGNQVQMVGKKWGKGRQEVKEMLLGELHTWVQI